ncbi:MAG: hypothetical protein F6J95_025970 [Leptolyngbya sp. SIO1E4]|nr:hypothetical protein [Leptolyngbya sp. SIO1E4]
MNCTAYLCEAPLQFTLYSKATHYTPSASKLPASETGLLLVVRQIAQTAQVGEWEALRLEQYFGPESKRLRFREILVPFIWAARQQVIRRVGADYHRLTLFERTQEELELLIQLNAVVEEEFNRLHTSPVSAAKIAAGDTFRFALSEIFEHHPQAALKMAGITLHWVNSTVELVDFLQGTAGRDQNP